MAENREHAREQESPAIRCSKAFLPAADEPLKTTIRAVLENSSARERLSGLNRLFSQIASLLDETEGFSAEELGAYGLLLLWALTHGPLPMDRGSLLEAAEIAPECGQAVVKPIFTYFEATSKGLVHKRFEALLEQLREQLEGEDA